MAFEHNDIVNKTRLMGELGEELMGFEHNDIVTMDVMNKAIEEGGGGGGSSDFSTAEVTVTYIKNPGATLIGEAGVVTLVGGEMEGADAKPLESGTFTLVLYKGKFNGTVIDVAAVTESTGSIVLGEAEEWEGNYETPVTITGDCAFTVTGVEL